MTHVLLSICSCLTAVIIHVLRFLRDAATVTTVSATIAILLLIASAVQRREVELEKRRLKFLRKLRARHRRFMQSRAQILAQAEAPRRLTIVTPIQQEKDEVMGQASSDDDHTSPPLSGINNGGGGSSSSSSSDNNQAKNNKVYNDALSRTIKMLQQYDCRTASAGELHEVICNINTTLPSASPPPPPPPPSTTPVISADFLTAVTSSLDCRQDIDWTAFLYFREKILEAKAKAEAKTKRRSSRFRSESQSSSSDQTRIKIEEENEEEESSPEVWSRSRSSATSSFSSFSSSTPIDYDPDADLGQDDAVVRSIES